MTELPIHGTAMFVLLAIVVCPFRVGVNGSDGFCSRSCSSRGLRLRIKGLGVGRWGLGQAQSAGYACSWFGVEGINCQALGERVCLCVCVCVCVRECKREIGGCLVGNVFETVEDPVEPSSWLRI